MIFLFSHRTLEIDLTRFKTERKLLKAEDVSFSAVVIIKIRNISVVFVTICKARSW